MKNDNTQNPVAANTPLDQALQSCRLMFKFALLIGLVVNLLMLATPIYSMQVLDRVISSQNTNTLTMLTLVIFLALGLLSALQIIRTLAFTKMGHWFEKRLSTIIFKAAVRVSLVNKAAGGSQQLRDLQTVKTFVTSPSIISMLDLPWSLIFVIVLFMIHFYMGLLTVIGGIILFSMALISDKITKPLHDSSNEHFISSMRQVDQSSRNAEVIYVMGMLANVIDNWKATNDKVQDNQNLVNDRQSAISEITKFVRLILQILTTGIGAYLVIQHEMSTGAIIACSSLSGRALAPFEQAIMSWKAMITCKKSYERLQNTLSNTSLYMDDKMELPDPKGAIEVENLYFAPQGAQRQILKGITFALMPGETLVVIGASGSGKTTLAKMLVGVWTPQMGAVRIDSASLNDWNREQLGKHIGYLPQDIELFAGTIRQNISRMNPEPDPEKIVQAAQLAGVHELILQFPKGYDTEIGMDGSMLSGGQKQRIGLARAFYGNPKILVLDEPNSNLDNFGEIALSSALLRAKENGITCIVVSHRTSLLSSADKILAMNEGSIALFGDRDEIMRKMNEASSRTITLDPSTGNA